MSVHAWRIVKAKNAASAFTGEGARLWGGRWTSPGVPAVYVAGSISLAMLEMLVHLQAEELLARYVLFEVTFEEAMAITVAPDSLPQTWRRSPPLSAIQRIGDEWITAGRSPVLRVPSVVVPSEYNYVLNPGHPGFTRITVGQRQPVRLDRRLLMGSSK